MYYNYYQKPHEEQKDCMSKGTCSVNPTLSSLQEFVLLYLKETAFYLLELKKLGIDNDKIKENIFEALSGIVIDAEYNEEQFQRLNSFLYENLTQAKTIYKEICKNHDLEQKVLKSYFKRRKNYLLAEGIKRGEKFSIKKNTVFTVEQKQSFDIMLVLLKSMCIKLLELKSLSKDYGEAYFAMLSLLNAMNLHHVTVEKAKLEIEEFIKAYYQVVKIVYWCRVGAYGVEKPVEVSFSTRPGKAILVSGNDLRELEMVLKATQDKGIDVYTNGLEMLIAHSFPKLSAYKNLVGHFGRGVESCVVDLATFPGPILMTRHSLQKTHDLYHGNIFTTDVIPPAGAVKIVNDDYEPLVRAALSSRGFSTGIQKGSLRVGYDEKEVKKVLNDVLDKMEEGKIKHLYFVGILNDSNEHSQYFDEFFNLVPKDCFIFSLSYNVTMENVYHIGSYYDNSLIYKIFREMTKRKPLEQIDMTVFITQCDKNIISNVLNFRQMGVKDVYMCECSPSLVNPSMINALRGIFGLKEFKHPGHDIQMTLNEVVTNQ